MLKYLKYIEDEKSSIDLKKKKEKLRKAKGPEDLLFSRTIKRKHYVSDNPKACIFSSSFVTVGLYYTAELNLGQAHAYV